MQFVNTKNGNIPTLREWVSVFFTLLNLNKTSRITPFNAAYFSAFQVLCIPIQFAVSEGAGEVCMNV